MLATRLGRLDLMQWVPGVPGDLAFEHLTRDAVETSARRPPGAGLLAGRLDRDEARGRPPQDLLDLEQLGTS